MTTTDALAAKDDGIAWLNHQGPAVQLHVDGQPFVILGGELHNSTGSSTDHMDPLWDRLVGMNLNTVLVTVSWELLEPSEGKFDFALVDYMIERADEHGLKLVLVWFGSWKNGQSSYAPMWVKKDTIRFPRVLTYEGHRIETLSPFSMELQRADANAFRTLMRYVREKDRNGVVIMAQPENEVGLFQDIDYNEAGLAAFDAPVPKPLLDYLGANRANLKNPVADAWSSNGNRKTGTWREVFGDNPTAREFLMAWQYATFINKVAKAGKEELPVPMFVNAWIVQKPGDLPGVYPNGGPVARVMDIYKAGAPDIDLVVPDIYLPNFKEIVAKYHRHDNALLVPESTREAGRAFYALAEHDAIGFGPFGVEDGAEDAAFAQSYAVLSELMPVIVEHQGSGDMFGILREADESGRVISHKGVQIEITYEKNDKPCYGLIIRTQENEYLVAGINFFVTFSSEDPDVVTYIGQVWEGGFDDEGWFNRRLLNGDETYHNSRVRALGRETVLTVSPVTGQLLAPQPDADDEMKIAVEKIATSTPGIYKVTTYQYETTPE